MHDDTLKNSMRLPHDVLTLAPMVQTMALQWQPIRKRKDRFANVGGLPRKGF